MKKWAPAAGAAAVAALGFSALLIDDGMEVTAFSFTSLTADVTGADDTVECNITVTGAVNAGCEIASPSGFKYGCWSAVDVADVYSCNITIPADSEAGTYSITHVFANNVGGTTLRATAAEIEGLPATIDVEVTSTNEDVTPILLDSFTASPLTIDPAVGATVTCGVTVDLSDTGTALRHSSCEWVTADGDIVGCGSGSDTCTFDIAGGATPGFWTLHQVITMDLAGNREVLDAATIGVLPGGGDTVLDLSELGVNSCARAADLVATNDGWTNSTAQTAASVFFAEAFVRTSGPDTIFAFGNSDLGTGGTGGINTDDAAVLIKFNGAGGAGGATGYIESVKGAGGYSSDESMPYDADTWYSIHLYIDMDTGTYNAIVTNCDAASPHPDWPGNQAFDRGVIARGADFQTGASTAGGLTRYAVYAPASVTGDIAADVAWMLWADLPGCTPATGSPGTADGCGGIQ